MNRNVLLLTRVSKYEFTFATKTIMCQLWQSTWSGHFKGFFFALRNLLSIFHSAERLELHLELKIMLILLTENHHFNCTHLILCIAQNLRRITTSDVVQKFKC